MQGTAPSRFSQSILRLSLSFRHCLPRFVADIAYGYPHLYWAKLLCEEACHVGLLLIIPGSSPTTYLTKEISSTMGVRGLKDLTRLSFFLGASMIDLLCFIFVGILVSLQICNSPFVPPSQTRPCLNPIPFCARRIQRNIHSKSKSTHVPCRSIRQTGRSEPGLGLGFGKQSPFFQRLSLK